MNFTAPTDWRQLLYQEKAAALILYGRALGLSHSEAEDALQDTFVALLRLEEKPDEPERYCLRAFRNRAMNVHRGLWRRLAREIESLRWFERASVDAESEALAVQALQSLPAEQREVVVLKIWHDMTFDAISRLLEISPNTAAGRYRYALNKLRVSMKGTDYERERSLGESVALLDAASPFG